MEGLHICNPPMEQRLGSDPTSWQCPDCGTWWDVLPSVPPDVAPAYNFTSHQGTVPAKWVRRSD